MVTLEIGDDFPSACTQVGYLPLRPLRKGDDSKLQFLVPTPAPLIHTAPLASGEGSDPLSGMQKVFNDDGGAKVCNTIDGMHPTPWGRQYAPFHLWVGGCRPVNIDIDWVSHRLDFGSNQGIVSKIPTRDPDLPATVFGDPLYPFKFRDERTHTPAPGGNPSLFVIAETKWFDEKFVNGELDGLDEGIWATSSRPMLTSDNDFVTFQARIKSSLHAKISPIVSTNNPSHPNPEEWVTQRTITCEEANDVLGTDETATELETWMVFGTNAGIILDNAGADPDLAPDGFAYIVNIEYQYSIA